MSSERRIIEPSKVTIKPCLQIAILFVGIVFAFLVVYLYVGWGIVTNRLDYRKKCIEANEFKVLPFRPLNEILSPAPFAHGYMAIDLSQLEVRWRLEYILYNITLGSIDLRGPLTYKHPTVAESVLAMGLQKNKRGHHFEGIEDINGKLANDIVERPDSYYVSFQDTTGREIMRDSLSKDCPNI